MSILARRRGVIANQVIADTDVALTGTASLSALFENNSNYQASHANDGDSSTLAIASANPSPAWIKIDLGVSRTISAIGLVNLQSTHRVTIQSSDDDSTWTNRVGLMWGNNEMDPFSLPDAVAARYWRLLDNASAGIAVGTFSLYESNGPHEFEPISGQDYARNGLFSSSGYFDTFGPWRALDGNDGTEAVINSGTPRHITLDMGAEFPIDAWRVWETQFGIAKDIASSDDGIAWTTRATVPASVADHSGSFGSTVYARYWRISSSGNMNLFTWSLFAPV